jgi:glycosyltransferase involved in cell wall biosynthesis
MTKRVVFYDKGTGGHRLPIQTVIRDWLRPSGYSFDIVVNPKPHNSFAFLKEMAQQERFDHCHLMTLHDCLEDDDFAAAPEEVRWFEKTGVSFSGTYYLFTYLCPHLLLARVPWFRWCTSPYAFLRHGLHLDSLLDARTAQQLGATQKIMQSQILKAVTIPDERLGNRLRYPFRRGKLRLLPDPAIFSNEPSDFATARKELGWNDRVPTVLMFGKMAYWKGLDDLIGALAKPCSHLYKRPLRVVLAGQQVEKRPDVLLSPSVELVEFDGYIEHNMAKKLFAATDCVVIPYKKYFEWSSGTFSLACASGKFIIAPNSGVLGWRVRTLRNGLVYRTDNPASLAMALSRFAAIYPDLSYPIEGSVRYAATCTPAEYVRTIDQIIMDSLNCRR